MKSSINKELEMQKKIILNEKNKTALMEILKAAIDVKLTDFKFEGIIYLKRIIEYDFSVIKLVGINKEEVYNFYIKIIKGGEIKKSVFCCWSLLQEEYEDTFENEEETIDKFIKVDKVSIRDNSSQKYKKKVSLKSEGNVNFNFEVNFIELEEFLGKFEFELIRKQEKISISKKDIMLIMVTKSKGKNRN